MKWLVLSFLLACNIGQTINHPDASVEKTKPKTTIDPVHYPDYDASFWLPGETVEDDEYGVALNR